MKKIIMFLGVLAVFFTVPAETVLGGAAGFNYKAVPKIITPSGSAGYNDKFYIFYKNLDNQSGLSGSVYNLMGMKVGSFINQGGAAKLDYKDPDTGLNNWEGYLYWDASGVPPGIYIWQIAAEGGYYSGTVVVAK